MKTSMLSAALVATTLVAASGANSAFADPPGASRLVIVFPECVPYWSLPQYASTDADWYNALSFAACIQDASVGDVDRIDELEPLVDNLQASLEPSLEIYVLAVQRGPNPVKIRAAYQIGMAELALVVRARASIAPPVRSNRLAVAHDVRLRAALDPIIREQAKLAWLAFTVVAAAVADDPTLAPDVVTRNMARAAAVHRAQLEQSWGFRADDPDVLAGPLERGLQQVQPTR